ncbi:MAG TPA: NADAR family protein [Kofleriaceae bacterium]|nr:NADAR family protein [Kofleriaceae bacterium]
MSGKRGGNEPAQAVRFYSVNAEYGEFSNFAPYPITLRGKRWPTSEHFFQAQKFAAIKDQDEIRAVASPMIAARMGRDRKRKLRRDWERVKVGIMREAVEAKFRQHGELRTLLLSTGDAKLVEHTDRDDFWGDGGDGSGRNELGRILMAVRESLREDVE